jgi:hypothetical protein
LLDKKRRKTVALQFRVAAPEGQLLFVNLRVEARFSKVICAESLKARSDRANERDESPKLAGCFKNLRVGYSG